MPLYTTLATLGQIHDKILDSPNQKVCYRKDGPIHAIFQLSIPSSAHLFFFSTSNFRHIPNGVMWRWVRFCCCRQEGRWHSGAVHELQEHGPIEQASPSYTRVVSPRLAAPSQPIPHINILLSSLGLLYIRRMFFGWTVCAVEYSGESLVSLWLLCYLSYLKIK